MPEASGMHMKPKIKTPLTATAIAVAVGWWMRAVLDPPTMAALAMVGIGGAGVLFFTLRPRLRPHPHSSLPLFPALVVA